MNSSTDTMTTLVEKAGDAFQAQFGAAPMWAACAPGRVNLIGEHTDYNDGFVLPMAIDRRVVIVAGPAEDGLRLFSADLAERADVPLTTPLERGEPAWTNYVRGVVARFQERGVDVPPLAAVIASDVPIGGGLSSSAALEVAAATLLEMVTGHQLEPVEKALLCQWAEHNYAGMPCGLMDQYTAVMGKSGHLVLIDCQSQTSRLVRFDDPAVAVLIANTCVKHELTGGEYAERRAQCEAAAKALDVPSLRAANQEQIEQAADRLDPLVFRRARHVIGEIARTVRAAELFEQGDWDAVGELMYASHASLRDDFEVSCSELDTMVEAARAIGPAGGVYGSRMTGGGFGGCTVSLVRTSEAEQIADKLRQSYEQQTGIEPAIFASQPSDGAQPIPLKD